MINLRYAALTLDRPVTGTAAGWPAPRLPIRPDRAAPLSTARAADFIRSRAVHTVAEEQTTQRSNDPLRCRRYHANPSKYRPGDRISAVSDGSADVG
jgi:hypothetical protein